MNIEIAARQLESLGSPTRLRIYRRLVRAGQTGLSVGILQDGTGLAAALICRAEYPVMRALIGDLADECCADEGAVVGQTAVEARFFCPYFD